MTDKSVSGAIWFPWQRAIRTGLQVLAGVIIATAGAIATIALVAPQILIAVKDLLRPEDYALLASWVAGIVAVSLALSRIMAIPQVDAFLKQFGAGSVPKDAEQEDVMPVSAVAAVLGVPVEELTRDQYRDATRE